MKPRHLFAALLLGLGMSAGAHAEKLLVAVDTAFVPFEFEQDGAYTGFDIDLWKGIAERLDVDYELQPMDFNGIIPALQTGNVDLALAAISVTADREKAIDYSYPYYDSGVLLMVRSGNDDVRGTDDLSDKVVGVKQGTAAADFIDTLDTGKVIKFPNIGDAYLALRTRRVDVAAHDTPNVLYYIKTAGDGDVKAVGSSMDAQSYAIGFPQGSALRDRVNVALLEMMSDGSYDAIYERWFGKAPQ
ncbi:glutamine ABC transporter substrate-binding protein GlnH [Arhodomonas aquaeolei]|uniref:glutamine ABC transporter substrate-binding protein GlnH n=1 Tax=Arhodomonas aquaeolei TaxID=2369 RepID=UPI00036B2A54|nr:glutamine ABC transporter substrate-binding protein GlnH [Arhodomonas aquaeolei]